MTQVYPSNAVRNDEIRFSELVQAIKQDKILILAITTIFTLATTLAAFTWPEKYEAHVVFSPTSDSSGGRLGGLGSLASQFGGLAALTGISVSGDSKKEESVAVLQSDALTKEFIKDNNLLPIIFHQQWNVKTNSWITSATDDTPTIWKGNEYFKKKIRTVTSDNKTGLVTLSITWEDPKLAADWANSLVKLTNAHLKQQALERSKRNISYLNEQASKTDSVSVKQAIYSILQSEINTEMLAQGNDEYAFKIIDAASPPEKASSPLKKLWISFGFIFGMLISVFLVLAKRAWKTVSLT